MKMFKEDKKEKKSKQTILTKKLLDGVPIGTIVTGECTEWDYKRNMEIKKKFECVKVGKNLFNSYDYGGYSTRDVLGNEIHSIAIPSKHDFVKVRTILDSAERRYLYNVVRPFKDRVQYITKETGYAYDKEKLRIQLEGTNDFELPEFEEDTMYKGMELNKEYTIEQLGLQKDGEHRSLYDELKARIQKETSIEELEREEFFINMADHLDDVDYMLLHLINERIRELKK